MAQTATRQMSAVRARHAARPNHPEPAAKPGEPSTATAVRRGSNRTSGDGADEPSGRGTEEEPVRGTDERGMDEEPARGTDEEPARDASDERSRDADEDDSGSDQDGEGMQLALPQPHLSTPTRLIGKAVGRVAKRKLRKLAQAAEKRLDGSAPALLDKPRAALEKSRDVIGKSPEALEKPGELAFSRFRPAVPIQTSIDVAVPLDFAWQQWMELSFLPEGVDQVVDIERSGDELSGRLAGGSGEAWDAQILDEREGESFAWRSDQGSDCAGLVTFHRLSDRLTRLELTLDVVPRNAIESASLLLRIADWRTRQALRRFKADLEVVSPDVYADDQTSQS